MEWLPDLQEACDRPAQYIHGTVPVVAGFGVVHRLPQSLDRVHRRMAGGLDWNRSWRAPYQPALYHLALVDGVVVEDERDALGPSILAAYFLK